MYIGENTMRKWIFLALAILLAACNKNTISTTRDISLAGDYILTDYLKDGVKQDLSLYSSDHPATLYLKEDGTGTFDAFGTPYELKWDENYMYINDGTSRYSYDGNALTLTEEETVMVFQRKDPVISSGSGGLSDIMNTLGDASTAEPTPTPPSTAPDPTPIPTITPESTQQDAPGYAFWNGFHYDENGQIRYKLESFQDLKLGFILHCWFQEGSPEWEEHLFTLTDLEEGAQQVTVHMVLDNHNQDLTYQFKSFILYFGEDCAILEVERDPATLSGGPNSSIQTGTYTLVP